MRQWWTASRQRDIKRWLVTVLIGLMMGVVAVSVNSLTRSLIQIKFNSARALLETARGPDGGLAPGGVGVGALLGVLGTLLVFSWLFIAVAAALVLWEPIAAGSGIPEVKCFLNGIDLPDLLRPRALVAKVQCSMVTAVVVQSSTKKSTTNPSNHRTYRSTNLYTNP